jgi:hypothetical protein
MYNIVDGPHQKCSFIRLDRYEGYWIRRLVLFFTKDFMIREDLIGSEQCPHQRLFYSLTSVLGLQLPWVDIFDKVMSAAGIAYYGSHLSPYGTKEIWHECQSMVLL